MKKKDLRQELANIYGITDIIKPEHTVQAATMPEEQKTKKDNAVNTPSLTNVGWDELDRMLTECVGCRLASGRANVVRGEGSRCARLMFVGEGPGAQEDETGRPFVGRAGQLLTKMIEAMQMKREDVFIANIVKCRPPDNRKPFKDEADICIPFLHRQIDLINPKVIVCLGDVASTYLLNSTNRISKIRGTFQNYNGIRVMPTYHPAYLLRNPSAKREAWSDLKEVMAELNKL